MSSAREGWSAPAAALPAAVPGERRPGLLPLARMRALGLVVLTAALLSVAAGLAVTRLVADSERERADARLSAELSGAVRALDTLGAAARTKAVRLARSPAVQQALATRNRDRLEGLAIAGVSFEAGGQRLGGRPGNTVAASRAAVMLGGREVGVVVAGVPVRALERRTALAEDGRLIVLSGPLSRAAPSPSTAGAPGAGDRRRRPGVARHLASTDELTQLANRRHFDKALRAEVTRAGRFDDSVAVVVADLDNFKEVNDRHGHDAGDVVLQAFADVIRASVRDIDLPARYGGEEFTVLLSATDAEGGRQLAERLRTALQALPILIGDDALVRVTCSFGVAGFPAASSAVALLRAADRPLPREGGGQERRRGRQAGRGGGMTSARISTLARCRFCGREFDNRRFQVFVEGTRGAFHSADCALRAAAGETPEARHRPQTGQRPHRAIVR